ncbi:hypothetical protein [Hyphomonas chukchiensis]|uniref:Band 7 domain-containing protein n=1 Tax=Hyphomonas chukchiensis TaxID=1280947 RepID=A0A062UPI6_9PROT|nr:hypothetical protein [Hyphomonas chukchiensis]KCZ59466.1 hypothetical protein HY30_14455 [Hyphomonas chukchiensis]
MAEVDAVSTGLIISVLVALLVVALAVAAFLYRTRVPSLVPGDDETYLIRSPEGRIQALTADMKVQPEDPRIVQFQNRKQLRFPVYDPRFNALSHDRLVTDSGAISLRIHTTTPFPFTAVTNDGHTVTVTPSVSFAVDPARVTDLARLGDFGDQFERRIRSAFSGAIGRRKDEQLRESHHQIESEVTEELAGVETGTDALGVPLGITVFEARFSYRDGAALPSEVVIAPDTGATAAMPVTSADGADTAPDSPQRVALAPAASRGESPAHTSETPGAMQFLGTDLDKLLDQFRDRSPEQIATLLSLMEMQTRQNIVSMLSKSGGLVVFSARELGLKGNPVLQERLSAASNAADEQPETE